MIKKGDSVAIDYVASENNNVFDTTIKKVAEENKILKENAKYEPITIIVGAGHVIKGLEESLIGKKEGEEYEVEIEPEKAFGKREPEKMKLIPMAPFKRDKVKPRPGMMVNIDGMVGVVASVSGGRVIVDFNHPLAGRKIKYKVWVRKILKNKEEKIKGIFNFYTGMDALVEGNEIIFKGDVPSRIKERIFGDIKKYLGVDEVRFVEVWK